MATAQELDAAVKAIGDIEGKSSGYVELCPAPLRNKLSAQLIEKIAKAALDAAEAVRPPPAKTTGDCYHSGPIP